MDIAEVGKKNKQKNTIRRLLWPIICEQIWQPRRNGQLSGEISSAKTESRRNRSFEETNH